MKFKGCILTDEDSINKGKLTIKDELRTEYNLKNLQVRKVGHKRKSLSKSVVQLDIDVAEASPDKADADKML